MPSAPRVAATVQIGDVVHLDDGTAHTVHTTIVTDAAMGGLTLVLRFTDGGVLRVGAGVELDVERPQ
ncbi:hypothetical protein [Streptomyces sp. NPDC048623]|uniref:hypothetical protein n=1 Tax=Streptomyces sp. NPDC048623 TaxID=3155761 RepID=UPI003437A640